MIEQVAQLDALASALKKSGDNIGTQLWLVNTKLSEGGLLRSLNRAYVDSSKPKQDLSEQKISAKILESILSTRDKWIARLEYLSGSKDDRVICGMATLYKITFEEAPDLFNFAFIRTCNLLFSFTKSGVTPFKDVYSALVLLLSDAKEKELQYMVNKVVKDLASSLNGPSTEKEFELLEISKAALAFPRTVFKHEDSIISVCKHIILSEKAEYGMPTVKACLSCLSALTLANCRSKDNLACSVMEALSAKIKLGLDDLFYLLRKDKVLSKSGVAPPDISITVGALNRLVDKMRWLISTQPKTPISSVLELVGIFCERLSSLEAELIKYPSESTLMLSITVQPVICIFCELFSTILERMGPYRARVSNSFFDFVNNAIIVSRRPCSDMARCHVYRMIYNVIPLMDASFSRRVMDIAKNDIKLDLDGILHFLNEIYERNSFKRTSDIFRMNESYCKLATSTLAVARVIPELTIRKCEVSENDFEQIIIRIAIMSCSLSATYILNIASFPVTEIIYEALKTLLEICNRPHGSVMKYIGIMLHIFKSFLHHPLEKIHNICYDALVSIDNIIHPRVPPTLHRVPLQQNYYNESRNKSCLFPLHSQIERSPGHCDVKEQVCQRPGQVSAEGPIEPVEVRDLVPPRSPVNKKRKISSNEGGEEVAIFRKEPQHDHIAKDITEDVGHNSYCPGNHYNQSIDDETLTPSVEVSHKWFGDEGLHTSACDKSNSDTDDYIPDIKL